MTPTNPVRPRRTILRESARPEPVRCTRRDCLGERRELIKKCRDLERKYHELNRVYWDEQVRHLERLEILKKLEEENANMRKKIDALEEQIADMKFEMNNVVFNFEYEQRVVNELQDENRVLHAENRALVDENIELLEQVSAYEALTPTKMDYAARLLAGMINEEQPAMFYRPGDGDELPECCPVCMEKDEGRFAFSFVCGFRHAVCLDCFLKIIMDGRNHCCPVCRAKYEPGQLSTVDIEKK